LSIPIVVTARVLRSADDRQDHRPRLADLGADIYQDADTIMMLHRPELHDPGQNEGIAEVIVGKQRNGPTGDVTLAFSKQFMRFENFVVESASSFV
jgi:replicative DNA helicase